jgi:ribosome biogenesis GTPase A
MPQKPSGHPSSQSRTAFQLLQQQLKHVDLVIEVLDARAPFSSRHPRAVELFSAKPRLIIMSKKDLADDQRLKYWLDFFSHSPDGDEVETIALSLKTQVNKGRLFQAALELTAKKREQLAAKGLLPRPIRICVVGMPNVGKSSFINWIIGQKKARVGNKPGVTKGPQWVRVHPQIELLDTPGVLPTVTFAEQTAQKLALLNLLPESSYDMEEIAMSGIDQMKKQYPTMLARHIGASEDMTANLLLEQFARKRNFIKAGGKLDSMRAAGVFVHELRDGKLGKVTLDQPPLKL